MCLITGSEHFSVARAVRPVPFWMFSNLLDLSHFLKNKSIVFLANLCQGIQATLPEGVVLCICLLLCGVIKALETQDAVLPTRPRVISSWLPSWE